MFGKKLLMAIPPLLLTVLLVSLVAAEVTDSSPINSEAFHNTGDIVQVTPEGGNYYYYPSLVQMSGDSLMVFYSECCWNMYSKTSDDGGATWSDPILIEDGGNPDVDSMRDLAVRPG